MLKYSHVVEYLLKYVNANEFDIKHNAKPHKYIDVNIINDGNLDNFYYIFKNYSLGFYFAFF